MTAVASKAQGGTQTQRSLWPPIRPLAALGTALLLIVALLVTTASASARPHRANASAARGGNLSVDLVGVQWGSLDPASPYTGLATWPVQALIFDPLIIVGRNDALHPNLATSWKYSNSGKTLTIKLRKGVKFQDGTPFNAQAVAFNLMRQIDPANHSLCAPDLTALANAKARGSHTVVLTLSSADYAIPAVLAETGCAFMGSPTAIKKEGSNFGNHPVGTGPFKFANEVTNTSLTVNRWSGYWKKGQPHLNSVTVNLLTDGTTAYDAIQSGEAQVLPATTLDPVLLNEALHNPSLKVMKGPFIQYDYIRFEVSKPPFNKVNARRAVDYATNQAQLVKQLDYGLYSTITSPISTANWAYTASATKGYPSYDLAKAKALVKKLGGLHFTLIFNNTSAYLTVAEALKAQWAQAGIHASLVPEDFTTLLTRLHSHDYQALANGWGGGGDPDSDLYFQFHSGQIASDSIHDPTMDTLLTQARAESSKTARKATYAKFSKAWNSYVPWDLLPSAPSDTITTSNVHGLTAYDNLLAWGNVSLSG